MSYDYSRDKTKLETEAGQAAFQQTREMVRELLNRGGAFRPLELSACVGQLDATLCVLSVDRMVELGELYEVGNTSARRFMFRVFIRGAMRR